MRQLKHGHPCRIAWLRRCRAAPHRLRATISAELFISAKTVDHHVPAILAKLGTRTANAAAAQAARLGLVGGAGAAENAG